MTALLSNLSFQIAMLGMTVAAMATVTMLFLWNSNRSERFLPLWACASATVAAGWALHFLADSNGVAATAEMLLRALAQPFVLLGAYEALPPSARVLDRWRPLVPIVTAIVLVSGWLLGSLVLFAFVMAVVVALLTAFCMWLGYRVKPYSGYLLAGAAFVLYAIYATVGLAVWGDDVRRIVFGPIISILIAAGLVLTSYQRAEREGRDADRKLRLFFEITPTPLLVTDSATGAIESYNRAMLEFLGIDGAELMRSTLFDCGLLPDAAGAQTVKSALEHEGSIVGHEVIIGHGVAAATFLLTARRIEVTDGSHDIVVLYDLTQLRSAQQALEKLNASLEHQVRVRTRDLEAFSYTVSHDLRAPLRAISGFTRALADALGPQPAATSAHLDRIQANSARMAAMIDSLLELARHAGDALHFEIVNLSEVVEEVRAELSAEDPARLVHWQIQGRVSAVADVAAMRIVLENLVRNAWKYTSRSADPHISFGAQTHEGHTTFFVKDNGAGFDARQAQKLFQPFQRLHPVSEFEGTGIGLATAERLVNRHGGRIWAESVINQGATFFFTLGEELGVDAPTASQRVA